MRKKILFPLCCCLGVFLSSLLPWGVLRWGQTLTERPFALPEVTDALPGRPSAGEMPLDMEQTLLLLEKGTRRLVTTIAPGAGELDAAALLLDVQEEIEELQARAILSPEAAYSVQSAALAWWSMPEGKQADLWEFTLSAGEEVALVRYDAGSGRVLWLRRELDEISPGLEATRKRWSGYLADYSLPGSPQVREEEKAVFFSISPL